MWSVARVGLGAGGLSSGQAAQQPLAAERSVAAEPCMAAAPTGGAMMAGMLAVARKMMKAAGVAQDQGRHGQQNETLHVLGPSILDGSSTEIIGPTMHRIQQIVTDGPVFRVKICGVTRVADARDCAEAGADALGLNFYPPSPRSLSLAQAQAICEALPGTVARVGVFVNAPLETMRQTARRLSLDWIQLHGDEPPETAVQLAPLPVVRAFRLRQEGLQPLLEHLRRCAEAGQLPAAVLVDAYHAAAFGGTGQVVDWSSVAELVQRLAPLPVVLAGGLNPENVQEAIRTARPHAVDTASGVECHPGRKDWQRVRQFVARAHQALQSP